MPKLKVIVARKLDQLTMPLAIRLPSGERLGSSEARVTLVFADAAALVPLATGRLERLAEAIVKDRVRIEGSLRDLMSAVAEMVSDGGRPVQQGPWARAFTRVRSFLRHSRSKDVGHIQSHYDISDDFFALWLDPKRIYSCGYFREPSMSLAEAQEAKLGLICRKLDLRAGESFLDVGAGWGGLMLHAARHYGVNVTGITLSRNQFDHVKALIAAEGLSDRVDILLCDYRDLDPEQPFDKLASVGMFEHVGRANMRPYFQCLYRLVRPGGLVLNHGITATGLDNAMVAGGLGDFLEKYIFPGGELIHVSHAIRVLSQAGLEMVDTENLRPHYAKTLWSWSDALEANLTEAGRVLARSMGPARAAEMLRAYELYLAGCALAFEQGWMALYQILLVRPDHEIVTPEMPGAQSVYPFRRNYIYDARSHHAEKSEGSSAS
ncbi:class I SAM-dependent methyltransferase [Paracoccus saliphilus]|uniref:Class I SAM-dependent methyltransferase n=1 Tax=Paracoccus saliphilus TaxID=405559 RepID=A0AA46A4W7_9RHOB|nr:class I SAM-dependent methyltransferase [Paracoccus saliphilus]WCR05059.1 class I SAM-dependent methyltransferase [Paracoccus saliphilus]SIS70657.1 cyclopropane-fatty-acyl-phospholipid synthase [Paracoccus saliphilus]